MSSRIWQLFTGAIAFGLMFAPVSGFSSATEDAWRPAPPDETHVSALEDLSSWLGQATEAASGRSLRLPDDLLDTIAGYAEVDEGDEFITIITDDETELLIKQVDGNVSRLAETVKMERTHLYRKMRSLNIDPKKFGR